MEQTLGHVTHGQNLRDAIARQTTIEASWIPIPFEVSGPGRYVPAYANNWSVRASYRARRGLSEVLATWQHDVLFFHTQVTSLFSVRLMRRLPAVVSLDATPINFDSVGAAYGHSAAGHTWLDARKSSMNRASFQAARALVTWSEWAAASLVADYGIDSAKISVIAPGAARAFFAIGAERQASTTSGGVVRLLFVGGDFQRKGGADLLGAFAAARADGKAELHIVTRDAVASRPGVFVHRGIRPNSTELLDLIRQSDIFVLPSRGECLSIALMEATAAGMAVISTNVGALGEAAVDGQNAHVVVPGDPRGLRSAIASLVEDKALRTRFGRAGHALARQRFDAERNNQAILDILASVARPMVARSVA
ncbi:MAG TPA: glycosyltransferase family 4 protein [Candidatus Limnocylindria bacterium]